MRTKNNILYHTFIALPVEIIKASDRSLGKVNGKIVDETKNLIVVEKNGREIRVPKASSTFRFSLDNGEKIDVEGRKIVFRPEERAKKV